MARALILAGALIVAVVDAGGVWGQTYGSWYADTKGQRFVYALSVNDSGNVLGQFCYPSDGTCVWLIGMKTACSQGEKYPVLANSDAGSAPLQVYCDGQLENGLYRYAFTDFDPVDRLVRHGTRIGFAVPLQQDEFQVVRFELKGAVTALAVMRAIAETRTKPAGPATRGTRDQRL